MMKPAAPLALLAAALTVALSPRPVSAATCYGDRDCSACHSCNYCKHCNSGGSPCGVYYRSRGIAPPWAKKAHPTKRHKAKRPKHGHHRSQRTTDRSAGAKWLGKKYDPMSCCQ